MVLLLHAVTVQAVGFTVRPVATYQALDLGVPVALLGLLSASYALAPLLLALPVGRAVDRWGPRLPMVLGGVLLLAATASTWLAPTTVVWLTAALCVAGVGHLLSVVGEQTLVTRLSPERATQGFARYTLASSLGQAAGPLLLTLGGISARDDAPELVMTTVLATALAAVALVSAALTVSTPAARTSTQVQAGAVALLRGRSFRSAVIVSGIVMACIDVTLVYLPALGRAEGIGAGTIGAVLALRALASTAVRLVLEPVISHLGRRWALGGGLLASSAALAACALAPSTATLFVAATVMGAGLGVCQPLTMAAVAELAPPDRTGTAMTLRIVANRLGVVVVPTAIGLIAGTAGPAAVLLATSGLLAAGWTAARRTT